jgi:N-ethylmaleimide reductase
MYLHVRGPAPGAPGADREFGAFARYRNLFDGPLIANNGFNRETGNAIVAAGIADAVSFASLFIANPDLVTRFALDQPLATSDRSTHYSGGACGYVDYPMWPGDQPCARLGGMARDRAHTVRSAVDGRYGAACCPTECR